MKGKDAFRRWIASAFGEVFSSIGALSTGTVKEEDSRILFGLVIVFGDEYDVLRFASIVEAQYLPDESGRVWRVGDDFYRSGRCSLPVAP